MISFVISDDDNKHRNPTLRITIPALERCFPLLCPEERKGELRVGSESFPARLLDLPTVTESWKTYDGANLVKSADIGQIVVIGPAGPSEDATESADGITISTRCLPYRPRTPLYTPCIAASNADGALRPAET